MTGLTADSPLTGGHPVIRLQTDIPSKKSPLFSTSC